MLSMGSMSNHGLQRATLQRARAAAPNHGNGHSAIRIGTTAARSWLFRFACRAYVPLVRTWYGHIHSVVNSNDGRLKTGDGGGVLGSREGPMGRDVVGYPDRTERGSRLRRMQVRARKGAQRQGSTSLRHVARPGRDCRRRGRDVAPCGPTRPNGKPISSRCAPHRRRRRATGRPRRRPMKIAPFPARSVPIWRRGQRCGHNSRDESVRASWRNESRCSCVSLGGRRCGMGAGSSLRRRRNRRPGSRGKRLR